MRSYIPFFVGTVLAIAVQASPDLAARGAVACKPSGAGGCSACGTNFVSCGSDACYDPVAGDICCSNRYSCSSTSNCSASGIGCSPRQGNPRECPEELRHKLTSSSTLSSATLPTPSSSTLSSASTTSSASSSSTHSSSGTTTDSNTSTANLTTTITSTTTSTVTVSMTNPSSTGACAATNPLTTPMAPFGNSSSTSMVALNTTTSTLSLTNVSSTVPGTVAVAVNTTKPTGTIVPPINGFKGGAGRAEASMFAFGSLVFMAALLI